MNEEGLTDAPRSVELVVVTGLSGSGKTTALRALEDLGYFCVDNLPGPLLGTFLRLIADRGRDTRAAVAMDIREGSYFSDLARILAELEAAGQPMRVLMLDCTDDTKVIRRFKETRRRHPLLTSGEADTISTAIQQERAWLEPLRAMDSTAIDTSDLNVHELKRRIQAIFGDERGAKLSLHVLSFGFRHGLPAEADFVFDVRFLPNPYFVESLRAGSGLDAGVSNYVLGQSGAVMMLDHIAALLSDVLPRCEHEGRATLSVAIGCTGGRHRSVALAEALTQRLGEAGRPAVVSHRDIAK